jgi:hypothetical protein
MRSATPFISALNSSAAFLERHRIARQSIFDTTDDDDDVDDVVDDDDVDGGDDDGDGDDQASYSIEGGTTLAGSIRTSQSLEVWLILFGPVFLVCFLFSISVLFFFSLYFG